MFRVAGLNGGLMGHQGGWKHDWKHDWKHGWKQDTESDWKQDWRHDEEKLMESTLLTSLPGDTGLRCRGKGSPHALYLGAQRTKNELLAESLGLPRQDVDSIVNLPMDEFSSYALRHSFTEEQMNILRDIRRRGKNLVAAHNCRRRKIDEIDELREKLMKTRLHVEQLNRKKQEYMKERDSLKVLRKAEEINTLQRLNLDIEKYSIEYDGKGNASIKTRDLK
ncbi:nuclear factor erythroid 2-related factor 2 [Eurytemora carolleeae]|uniref:nuclear factor erythroid 2-related factor 2 n=1 Tax=Eurytemora carolleeae TaxID=1294199 RepID=UPI000C765904|nr:nuclear factor erythroid 2-related factor 2 [Eurytemora carolleeae]|eukprot:XP_023346739.1 nuclear factor erythroid 2-related factor 2-like [Eurytemora affinis]